MYPTDDDNAQGCDKPTPSGQKHHKFHWHALNSKDGEYPYAVTFHHKDDPAQAAPLLIDPTIVNRGARIE
jgi:hypothetical protein